MNSRQKILLILLPILLLALGLRLIGIEKPLFEREPSAWRQIQTNSTSQGYLYHGFKFFYPEVNFLGNPGYFAQELPLYQYSVALLYKFFGENILWGRLLTIAASLGALTYLYFILRRFLGEVPAAMGSLYFALAPLSAYYGRTVMIDTPALFLSLGFTYHFWSYLEAGRRCPLALALILATLAVLIKVTTALLFLGPLLILPWFLEKKAVYRKWEYYLFLCLPLLVGYGWKIYAEGLNLQYGTPYFKYTASHLSAWYFGPWEMRLDPFYYQILFTRMLKLSLPWGGILLAAAGIILSFSQKRPRLLLLYLLSAILYLLTFTNLNYVHEYYQLPLVPIYAAFIGVTGGFAQEQIKSYALQSNLLSPGAREKFLAPAVVVLVGVFLLVPGLRELRKHLNYTDYELMNTGKQIEKILPPQALVIAVTCDEKPLAKYPQMVVYNSQPKTLYAVGHRGWNLNFSQFTLSKLERLKQEEAHFLVMDLEFYYPYERMWRDMIVESLRKNFKEIFISKRFLVFDLKEPPLSPGTRPGKAH